MKTKHPKIISWIVLLSCLFFMGACNDEDMGTGDVEFEITDAPIDDASVSAVMVTIADVKINGQSISGFSKQTINLMAYQDGNTKALATALQLDARTYNNLTLVLDLDQDADGDAPGCYVRTLDNTKYKLKSTASGTLELTINKGWTVRKNVTTNIVLDFDLRKSITYSENTEQKYRFVSDANLTNAIRVVAKANAGKIEGSYEETVASEADQVIVFAYKKGTFNETVETQPQDDDNLLFANAVASTKVKSSLTGKTFVLALLEEGEYELYFAKYMEEGEGEVRYNALLQSETSVNGTPSGWVVLKANLTTTISSNITGLF